MTKDTLRGNADRRAVLRSILAGGAVAAFPAARAIAAPGHPDAALLALQPEIDAADPPFNEALDALTRAEEAYFAARPPEPKKAQFQLTYEEFSNELRKVRDRPPAEKMKFLASVDRREAEGFSTATEAWDAECARLSEACGVNAAEEREAETGERVEAIRRRIIATRATTLDGLRFKARFAAEHRGVANEEEIIDSIIADVLAT